MWIPRLHQKFMYDLAHQIKAGRPIKEILFDVTPGGGKSLLPVILSAILNYKIAWIVPRNSLRDQAVDSFYDINARRWLGHKNEANASQNDFNPSRGRACYVDTYQGVVAHPKLHIQELERHEYIACWDEPQHIRKGGKWDGACRPVSERAKINLYMSGTFFRHDNQPIFCLDYKPIHHVEELDFSETETRAVFRYNRADAISEKAIVPLHFEHLDGQARWINEYGEVVYAPSFSALDINNREALRAACETEYAHQLILQCAENWYARKSQQYSPAKFLVTAPTQRVAREYYDFIRSEIGDCEIAVSSREYMDKKALDAIKQVKGKKKPERDILITVGMAYEGLDIPELTHLACLTLYRSRQWLEQLFPRVGRYRPNKLYGSIYAPDDPYISEVIDRIKKEQGEFAIEKPDKPPPPPPPPGPEREGIIALASKKTGQRAQDLGNITVPMDQTEMLNAAARQVGLNGHSTVQLWDFIQKIKNPTDINDQSSDWETLPEATYNERVTALKGKIDRNIKRYCMKNFGPTGGPKKIIDINDILKKRFGNRDELIEEQLLELWKYVKNQGWTATNETPIDR